MTGYYNHDRLEAERLHNAVCEANRFITRATTLLEVHRMAKKGDREIYMDRLPERAAVKRSSLDLNDALVAVRKPRHG